MIYLWALHHVLVQGEVMKDFEGCLKAEVEISIHLPCTQLMFETQNHNSMKTQVFLGNWSLWLQISPYAQHTCTLEVFVDVLLQEQWDVKELSYEIKAYD